MLFLWRPATYSWGDHENFDKRDNHDGFTNKISFTYQCKKIVLKPLSPQKVCEDQRKMREKILQEKREKERSKEGPVRVRGKVEGDNESSENFRILFFLVRN